jgi:HTH-type transcriptional regulator/antitoxin HigA
MFRSASRANDPEKGSPARYQEGKTAVSTKAIRRTLPDTYFKLVKRFPLTHIQDEETLTAAQEVLDQLLRQNLDAGGEAYLDALTDLIEIHEQEQVAIPEAPAIDVLKELMAANRLTQSELGKKVGIAQSTISAILHGTRSITLSQATALAKHFGIARVAFLRE